MGTTELDPRMYLNFQMNEPGWVDVRKSGLFWGEEAVAFDGLYAQLAGVSGCY